MIGVEFLGQKKGKKAKQGISENVSCESFGFQNAPTRSYTSLSTPPSTLRISLEVFTIEKNTSSSSHNGLFPLW